MKPYNRMQIICRNTWSHKTGWKNENYTQTYALNMQVWTYNEHNSLTLVHYINPDGLISRKNLSNIQSRKLYCTIALLFSLMFIFQKNGFHIFFLTSCKKYLSDMVTLGSLHFERPLRKLLNTTCFGSLVRSWDLSIFRFIIFLYCGLLEHQQTLYKKDFFVKH